LSATAVDRTWRDSLRRIAPLAWPVLVGQVAVLAFATVDTVLLARLSALDLASLAVGAAAYITVFIGLMGVVLAVGPIVGQLFGAQRHADAGAQLQQAVWLALGLSVVGVVLLAFPAPFLALARAPTEVESKVRGYLLALAFALPPALLFTAFRGFNNAVSRPKAVMALQLGGLSLKVPLSIALAYGAGPLPGLGVTGCGIATAIVMWAQLFAAVALLRRDPFYRRFAIGALRRPDASAITALLRLGVPMGLSILIEVTGFTFMTFYISRIGATAVAGHQIVANLLSLLFMVPLALGNATGTLVAQSIGANRLADARRIGWHGVAIALVVAAVVGTATYLARGGVVRAYTDQAAIAAAALPLLAWLALFHIVDAAQCVISFVLRAWRIAVVPLIIFASSIWGVGLGGGYLLAFDVGGQVPPALHGARGFWIAATVGLGVAAIGLALFLAWVLRQQVTRPRTDPVRGTTADPDS
jgi:MATE family multidrug resistance protein